jgi:hypothetical protein
MPWELTIVNAKDRQQPLGDRADVVARIAAALPGTLLQEAPGPSPELIAEMPPALREHFLRPRPLSAFFEGVGFTIEFAAENEPLIRSLSADVRGDGNPVPALTALCRPNGWAVINIANGAVVDLTANESVAWNTFQAWRDKAIQDLSKGPKSE